ncbi:unnamed protein product [Zymoseptoria tritici ST99CH_1A5]|uniref:CCHC-type domain-containing protein n=1 Tax=Zymoseptoria tritici ST99CH_1A5 TaxID=1276529 RepID=A0A1Y6LDV7_ZYMTR|nr:unnamed protein product [Zymoseptoria tritici ST99CH_1A5]
MQQGRAWFMEPASRHFNPSMSKNPFVNGARVYRFILGDPLCVLCGKTGHLNRECNAKGTSEELLPDEQKFLWKLVIDEQNRIKAARGLQKTQPTMALAPGNETIQRAPVRTGRLPGENAQHDKGVFRPYIRPEMEAMRSSVSRDSAPREEFSRDSRPRESLPERYSSYSPMPQQRVQHPQERYASPMPQQRGQRVSERHASRDHYAPGEYSSRRQYVPAHDARREPFDREYQGTRYEDHYHRHESRPPPEYERRSEVRDAIPAEDIQDRKRKFDEEILSRRAPIIRVDNSRGSSRAREVEVQQALAGPCGPDTLKGKNDMGGKKPTTFEPLPKLPSSNPNLIPLGMGAAKRMSNGEPKIVGPHPSTIRVSAPYITQSAVEKRLQPSGLDAQERNIAAAREDQFCLQGVTWLDNVRRALQLPIRTFTTACVYYHKFRLAHPTSEYSWSDAAAASLLTSCKNEDTLKKSKDILAAAYNMKQLSSHEQVGSDDPMFDGPSRAVVGVERLILESGAFDFRSRSPHQVLVKICKSLPPSEDLRSVAQLAWTVLTDLHRTFAPLKQTSATLSLASLEIAVQLSTIASTTKTCSVYPDLRALNISKWYTTRAEVMETLLDALDLYTHHTGATILGPKYSLDDLIRIRLAFNKECSESNLPRHTSIQPPTSPENTNGGPASTLRVANGHPTPVSPPQPDTLQPTQQPASGPFQPEPEGGGTLRFMLNPQRAVDERAEVSRYHVEEWEEYEEEIEVPLSRNRSRERNGSDRHRLPDRPERERDGRSREFEDRRSERESSSRAPAPPLVGRELERERLREREREAERERTRLRERERDRRYDDRRGHGGHGHGHRGGRDRRFEERGPPPYEGGGDRRRGPRHDRR